MRCETDPNQSFARLKAATYIREEICGPLPKAVQVQGTDNRPSIKLELVLKKPEEDEPRPQLPESVDPFELPKDRP